MAPNLVALEDSVPRVGKLQRRYDRNGERVFRSPRRGPIEQHAKLHRQGLRCDRGIHALAKRNEGCVLDRCQRAQLPIRNAVNVDRTLRLVERKRACSKHLGKAAVGITACDVELKEPVRALDETFGKVQIVIVVCHDVRHVPPIANDSHGIVQSGHEDAAVDSRDAMQAQLDVRCVCRSNRENARAKPKRITLQPRHDREKRRRVGALAHSRIGPLEKAHLITTNAASAVAVTGT
jgi:hypothetical protein